MTAPQRHDCAVVFSCDRNYLHYTLFMVRQLAFHNPFPRFDFIIATRDIDVLPDWAAPYGIILHRPGPAPEIRDEARLGTSAVPIDRLMLARELGDRYRRILYLDSDMFVEGGDINRLLDVDIGPHPVGMVLDLRYFMVAEFHAPEYLLAGIPPVPYANTGLQLIDTRAYCEQEIEQRSLRAMRDHPKAMILSDQSMTNIALRGKFAQLAPCWNWQISDRMPFMTLSYPVFLRHFIAKTKPDKDTTGKMDPRFNLAYREFLTNFMPEHLPRLSPQCDPSPLPFRRLAKHLMKHVASTQMLKQFIGRFPDPYRARI